MRGAFPGGKSITAKRVAFAGGALPMMRAPRSSMLSPMEMSAGARSVDQIMVETVPGLGYLALVAGPCMMTLAVFLGIMAGDETTDRWIAWLLGHDGPFEADCIHCTPNLLVG